MTFLSGRLTLLIFCSAMMLSRGFAAEFSKALTAEDFARAGLGKLTPAELERLDELVQAQRTGEVARVRDETAAKVAAETTVKVQAETTAKVKAEAEAAHTADSGSLLHRMRVILAPGTEIEYASVETEIKLPFSGYDPGTVLTLTNGQQWRVESGKYWAPAKSGQARKVIIQPGALGAFFLQIQDAGRVKVTKVGSR
ncbi:MAG: hypothetical protein ABIS43_16315 [Opitutus sp.]